MLWSAGGRFVVVVASWISLYSPLTLNHFELQVTSHCGQLELVSFEEEMDYVFVQIVADGTIVTE